MSVPAVFIHLEGHSHSPFPCPLPGIPQPGDTFVMAGDTFRVTKREWHVTHVIVFVSPGAIDAKYVEYAKTLVAGDMSQVVDLVVENTGEQHPNGAYVDCKLWIDNSWLGEEVSDEPS